MSSLRMTPPDHILKRLAEMGIEAKDVDLCVETDINSLGRYEKEWFIATTAGRLLVLSDTPPHEKTFDIKMVEGIEFRAHGVVGAGILQVRANGMFVDALRYTNRLSDKFHRLACALERVAKGEKPDLEAEAEADENRCSTCGMMLEYPGDPCPRCMDRGAVIWRMWKLLSRFGIMVVAMMGLLLVGIALDLVGPKLTQLLVDNVLPGSGEEVAQIQANPGLLQESIRMLLIVVAVLAGVQVLRMFVNIANGMLSARVGSEITYDMRGRLLEHLQKLSIGYYDKQQVGSLVGRVAYDTEALSGFVSQLTHGFLMQLIMVVGVGAMMFTLNVKLAFYTLIPAPLVIAGSILFWRYIYPRHYRLWDARSKQAGMLSGNLSGIRVVKAFSQEDREVGRFDSASRYLYDTSLNVAYSSSVFNPLMGLVFQLGGWIVWYVGGRNVLDGTMTLGSLMAFFGYLWMFYGPLGTLTQFTNWLTQFVTQAHRIFEILDTPHEIREPTTPVPIGDVKGAVKFERITFGYNRNEPVIQRVDLDIPPGEMLGIVGRSGSGKTTMINLLCRFYDVNEGRILLDGVDIRDIRTSDLRRSIGVVLQEPFLFRGNLLENISYGRPESNEEEIIAACKAANVHDFVVHMAHGYDTWVGERGAGLSGGERQRVGIARVLLTDPKILILDEATSNVDAETEAQIQAALAEVTRDRTTIAIAHRLSTLRNSDRIIVMEQGEVVETGTHEELVALNGVFARMMRIQGQQAVSSVDDVSKNMQLEDIEERDRREAEALSQHQGPLPPINSHHPRWLSPEFAHIHLGNLGALHVTIRDEFIYGGVFAVRCMPVNHPNRFISLRYFDEDKRDREVGLIRNLQEWPEEARNLVNESLLKRYFIHTISSIEEIKAYNGYLNFKVETDLGPKEFMMRHRQSNAQTFGENGRMLIDTDDNRFLIPDVDQLAESERKVFLRHIYW